MTFRILGLRNGVETLIDSFTRNQIQKFAISFSDNRILTMQMQNMLNTGFDSCSLVFTSIHKVY